MPINPLEHKELEHLDPYELRAQGLNQKLELCELCLTTIIDNSLYKIVRIVVLERKNEYK